MQLIAKLKKLFEERYFWKINSLAFNAIYSLFTLVLYNKIFMEKVFALSLGSVFVSLMFVVLFLLLNIACSLLFWKKTTKFLAILLLFINAFSFYFMVVYHAAIDKVMLMNVMETDVQEVKALLSSGMFFIVGFMGALPAYMVYKTEIVYSAFKVEILKKVIVIVGAILISCLIIVSGYKGAAQFLRNNKPLKYYLIPVNYFSAVISVTKGKLREFRKPQQFVKIAEDAKLEPFWKDNGKKNLFIFVVGETARAANFSLNGYEKDTNAPLVKYKNMLSYEDVSSCGTSTAISLPCIFSSKIRKDFSKSKEANSENLLDVIQRAGYKVWWRGNVTGCKGICSRVENEMLCKEETCFDEILYKGLKDRLSTENQDMFVILHQLGSHGPTYYKRYPKKAEKFKPYCNTERLDKCSREEIMNVYDNTIYYTSQNLAQLIEMLEKLKDKYNSMLVYVSDHGESLGENNIYLHAAPYAIAPDEQTHVPLLVWFDDEFSDKFKLDIKCLKANLNKAYSHDNIFHSFLGIMGINTSAYNKELDIFAECKIVD